MREKVLTDIKINCDPPPYRRYGGYTQEEYAKYCEEWVKDFHDFIRDHRSQDPVYLTVEREYEDQCSFCHYTWEVEENGCPLCCNAAEEEWEKSQQKEEVA